MPATPSANTIGIESRISAAKTKATVASSMNGPSLVLGIALRQRGDHGREAVDGDQETADHRRRVEPGEIYFESRCGDRTVEQAELEAVPRDEQANADDERVIEAVDPELRGLRQA